MRIVSTNGSTTLNINGVEYTAVDGVFEVPQADGESLVKFPSFERDYVAYDRATAEAEKAAKSVEGILARIANLEAAVFPNGSEPSAATSSPVPAPVAPVVVPEPVAPTPEVETPVEAESVEEPEVESPIEDASEPAEEPAPVEESEPVEESAEPVEPAADPTAA